MDETDSHIPDPFSVGDDEDETEEYEEDLLVPSAPAEYGIREDTVTQSPPVVQKDAPPIPPKQAQGDIRPLLSVNMFLPVPDVCPLAFASGI